MACPAEQRERKRFTGDKLRLVDALFLNSRALAKVCSAAEYLLNLGDDAHPLYVALEQLCHERRKMRTALEQMNGGQ